MPCPSSSAGTPTSSATSAGFQGDKLFDDFFGEFPENCRPSLQIFWKISELFKAKLNWIESSIHRKSRSNRHSEFVVYFIVEEISPWFISFVGSNLWIDEVRTTSTVQWLNTGDRAHDYKWRSDTYQHPQSRVLSTIYQLCLYAEILQISIEQFSNFFIVGVIFSIIGPFNSL